MGREKHSIEKQIQITLDILWAIKDEDKFYFMEYGKDHLRSLVKNCSTLKPTSGFSLPTSDLK